VQNFSANHFRRVDLTAQLPAVPDIESAMSHLRDAIRNIPHVLQEPEPDVEILTINQTVCTLAVRPFCHNDHYWQVYFDTNRVIGQMVARV
jgi:small conductance mechanosensitive channel